ncbi:MAG: hypothetical protein HOE54_14280 [Gammaproteobacteria bacterium]|nr:hypothetical protein [Gammaproteobacteria bacterium]
MKHLFALLIATNIMAACADDWTWAPDLKVGQKLPNFEALDSNDSVRHSKELRGSNGMMLFFNRSTVW